MDCRHPAGRRATWRRPPCSVRARRAIVASPSFGRVVGQIEDTFIVAHTADEVFFVDQHVAHERVLFERLRGEFDRGALASQELLFPLPLELAPAQLRAIGRVHAELERLGFALEGFGGAAILLRAVPSLLRSEDLARLADELSREIDEDAEQASSPVLDRLLAFVACRAAIKANQTLAPEEMARVLTRARGDRHALLLSTRTADRFADPARRDQARAASDLVRSCRLPRRGVRAAHPAPRDPRADGRRQDAAGGRARRALANRGRERGLPPGLPTYGHRYRQAHARRASGGPPPPHRRRRA